MPNGKRIKLKFLLHLYLVEIQNRLLKNKMYDRL